MSNLFKKVVSSIAAVTVALSIVAPVAGTSADYFGNSVGAANTLAENNIINDQSDNVSEYRLADKISREELSKVIVNLASLELLSGESIFADTDFAPWAEAYAKTLNENDMASSNTFFNPKDYTSKAEALKFVMSAKDIEMGVGSPWEVAYVDGGVEAGIANSFSDYSTDVTRGQVFIWAANALEYVAEDDDLLGSLLDDLVDEEDETDTEEEVVETPTATGTAEVSLSPETPEDGNVAVNTPRSIMLAFDVTAGAEDVELEKAELLFTGLGNSSDVEDVSIYSSTNESVSKQRSFSDNTLDLSFDKDVVVEAGTTATYYVAATIAQDEDLNTTYQIELTNLEASASVSSDGDIIGASLRPVSVTNKAKLSVDDNAASDTATVGERVKLAGFDVEEKADNEDVLIKTITLHQKGSIDGEYLSDLELLADGTVVASDLEVNSDDEIVVNLDYTLEAKEEVEFELRGVITGDVGETVHFQFESEDDIYAIGLSTGYNVSFDNAIDEATVDIASPEKVEGAEINVSFDKSDVDEAKPETDEVLVGTLNISSESDYEVNELTVTVTGTDASNVALTGAQIAEVVEELELDNTSYDEDAENANDVVYTFEDILLNAGDSESFELTFDVAEEDATSFEGYELSFEVEFVEIEDDVDDVTYTSSSTPDLNDILSTTAFDEKDIEIEAGSFELVQIKVNNTDLVLENGAEVVVYKAKGFVGDADTITINDIDFALSTTTTAGYGLADQSIDLDDVVNTATLRIDGVDHDGDIDSDSIDFRSLNHDLVAGQDDVEFLLVVELSDKEEDALANLTELAVNLDTSSLDVENSDNNDVVVDTSSANDSEAIVTIREEGTLAIAVVADSDRDEEIEETVLAGESGVALAELEIEAEYENVEIEDLAFVVAGGNFISTFENVRLVDESNNVMVDGGVVKYDGSNTTITFEDKFTVEYSDGEEEINALLVADLGIITTDDGENDVEAGNVTVTLDMSGATVEGEDSDNDLTPDTTATTTSKVVSIVPAIVTVSVEQELDTDEEEAIIVLSVDYGNNVLADDDLSITGINFTTASNAVITTVENDDDTDLTVGGAVPAITLTGVVASDVEVQDGDRYTITVDLTTDGKLEIAENGVTYDVDGASYTSANDNEVDLGTYKDSD